MNNPEIRIQETPVERLRIEFSPMQERIAGLQAKFADVIEELNKEAVVGEDSRGQVREILRELSAADSQRRASDNLDFIKNRKFFDVPSREVSEALIQANIQNMTPENQRQIQITLQIPADIQANFNQLILSADGANEIEDLIEEFITDSNIRIDEYEKFLENAKETFGL